MGKRGLLYINKYGWKKRQVGECTARGDWNPHAGGLGAAFAGAGVVYGGAEDEARAAIPLQSAKGIKRGAQPVGGERLHLVENHDRFGDPMQLAAFGG